ncbi:MAG TPA: hypothetical protein VI136_20505 [Verrucomicrobiae bacterium]
METTPAPAAFESSSLVARYAAQIAGQLSCFDRVIITGSLMEVCHPAALERQLHGAGMRCFDLGVFAEPLRDALRDHAVKLVREAGLEVEFLQRKNFRKEDRIAQLLARRGDRPGRVHVFSAMEPCPARDEQHRSYRGFNFFAAGDLTVLLAILRGEYHISGLSNRRLQRVLRDRNGGQIRRVLKRLRLHGLIRKIGHPYKYYVTALGQKVLLIALKLREHLILPTLASTAPT